MASSQNDKLRPIIVDIGTANFRIGWGGEDFPEIIAPSIYVDISDYIFDTDVIDGLEDIYINENLERYFYGHDALKYSNILKIHEFKKENNIKILVKFFHLYYQKLSIPEELQFKQPIIIITPFYITELEKTRLKQAFFDAFKFPKINFVIESQAVLATLQKTSGVIVDMGENVTSISTVFHGFMNAMSTDLFPIAGKDLTSYLLNLILTLKGGGKNIYIDKFLAKDIKEKSSLCLLDPVGEKKRVKEGLTKYNQAVKFPDGDDLEINMERFLLCEPLFNPKLLHIDFASVAETIAKVVKTWDRDNWEELISSVILSGGGSLIPGLKERIKIELEKAFPDKYRSKINIIAVSGRENMAWIGASILFSKKQLEKGWIDNPDLNLNNSKSEQIENPTKEESKNL